MFRKIVSNLSFSPALVGQLGFYAKRLRKEETTRRIGLIFTVFALAIQSLSVFQAPESANAASANDMVYGGVHSPSQVLAAYDNNTNNFKDLFDAIGVSRQDVVNATKNLVYRRSTDGNTYSWGLKPQFSSAQGEGGYTVKKSGGGTRTFYYRPHRLWGNFSYSAYQGRSSKNGMWFSIMRACGNLITQVVPPAPTCPPGQAGKYPNCYTPKCTIQGKTHLNANDPNCKNDPTAACTALSITKNGTSYQYTGTGSTQYGASITGYSFVVYRDGKAIKTLDSKTNTVVDKETTPGKYTVRLTLKTSLGNKVSDACVKTFEIVEPKKCPQNPSLLATDPNCQPCPGDSTLWIKDSKCKEDIVQTKTAQNASQNDADATTVTAKSSDRIIYKITVTNKGLDSSKYTIKEDLTDVLQYATIDNNGGGTLTKDTSGSQDTDTLLTWPEITLKPGESQTRIFSVKLLDTIPAKPTGTSDPSSYDCKMVNTFGNSVSIDVECPVQKQIVEQTVAELPHTGPNENMIFAGILFAIVTFFYARSRQLKKEVRLIRRDFNAGTI